MKFSIAVGILTQTIPAILAMSMDQDLLSTKPERKLQQTDMLQDTSTQSNFQGRGKQRGIHGKRILRSKHDPGTLRNAPGLRKHQIICDPTSTDADTGVLSCGEGNYCKPFLESGLGGVCTQMNHVEEQGSLIQHEVEPLEPVDVSSIDIGILGWEEEDKLHWGEETPSSSRRLDVAMVCHPLYSGYASYRCDCSGFNNATGTGTVYCLYENLYFSEECKEPYYNDLRSYTYEDSKLIKIENCDEIKVPQYQKACLSAYTNYSENYSYGSCTIAFNGKVCKSCVVTEDFYAFDCSNVRGGPVGNSVWELLPLVAECVQEKMCTNFCDQQSYIPEAKFDTNVTLPENRYSRCGEFSFLEVFAFLPKSYCTTYGPTVQESCCEERPSDSTTLLSKTGIASMTSLGLATLLLSQGS